MSVICAAMPGQKITSLARRLHLSTPRCELWTNFNISLCIGAGIIILLPLNMSPWWYVTSSRKFQYGLAPGSASGFVSGQPSFIILCKSQRAVSLSVSSLISASLGSVTGSWWIMFISYCWNSKGVRYEEFFPWFVDDMKGVLLDRHDHFLQPCRGSV